MALRTDVERFKAEWRPPHNAGRRLRPRTGAPDGPDQVRNLLEDWGGATIEELAEVVGRHPGNIRKYLKQLEVRVIAYRGPDGSWSLTGRAGIGS